ncbi:MAG: isochorismatase family protein [Pseudomonadota bacterium]
MEIDPGRTARVAVDPQLDFLDEHGVAWGEGGETILCSPHKVYGPEQNDLVLQLRKIGIDRVILAGMCANLCVASHMRALLETGFEVAIVRDATVGARVPERGGYLAAHVNVRMIATAVGWTDEALERISRTALIECAGNSLFNSLAEPQQRSAGKIHGLIGTAERTGVPRAILLEEAGIDPAAGWLLAERADAAKQSRSVPTAKARAGDALVARCQNGERLRLEQGHPMRLVLPGWQGSMQTKWPRRIRVLDEAAHAKDKTSQCTLVHKDGRARQFAYETGVKPVITAPSPGVGPAAPGLYPI